MIIGSGFLLQLKAFDSKTIYIMERCMWSRVYQTINCL